MPSIKAALDVDGSDEAQKAEAVTTLVKQMDRLARWVERHVPEQLQPEVTTYLVTLLQIRAQDIEEARYIGVRKNTFDLRRTAALQTLKRLIAYSADVFRTSACTTTRARA